MHLFIWILQGLMAFIFFFSGTNKAYLDEQSLVKKGQTGVEGLPAWLIKFIGISEIAGALGLVLPLLLNRWPVLTPIAAICLAGIMIPAAYIHYKRQEYRTIIVNALIFIGCGLIAWFR